MGKSRIDPKLKNFIKKIVFNMLLPTSVFFYLQGKIVDQISGTPETIAKHLGVLALMKVAYHVGKYFYAKIFQPPKDLTKYGKWAVITGSTSGIGEAYAHYLAKKGINILQISRSETKLKKVATDLKEYGVETDYLIHDYGVADPAKVSEFRAKLDAKLGELTSKGGVGILINSVGVANAVPTLVHEMDEEEVRQMLCINNDGTMLMTQAVLPHMMFRKTGAIITISSASCTHPAGLLTVYSATKAFGHQLTRSMYYEFKEYGIDCISVTPYYFVSNLFKRGTGTVLSPMPIAIIKNTTKYLGYAAQCNPYWAHRALGFCFQNYYYGHEEGHAVMKRSRARALAKMAKNK
uniref:Estradiol 17-beta-dehydrogenase 12 n=2 Tax=Leptocylindrus danicus TaxID=163516 RepID=A0A7S2KZI6_9STRA|mmetsp:Transcript_28881/g.42423  ORF Transcript_28881/g.42423 Transcript_28881/m.42423 type:complete len:350 (+) Transcript_28881:75-1124(+)